MSNIRIRQICLVAHDLDRVQQQLDAVFGIEVAHRDPGVGNYGLHNVLIPVGNQLLEIVAPKEGEHETPGGRFLKRRGGDGGYMVIMQVPKAAYAGYEEHVAERFMPRTKIFDAKNVVEDYTKYRWTEGKGKGPPCEGCTWDEVCEGPWKDYVDGYGWDEFVPRTDEVTITLPESRGRGC